VEATAIQTEALATSALVEHGESGDRPRDESGSAAERAQVRVRRIAALSAARRARLVELVARTALAARVESSEAG
jgi:hypothetical protein